MYKISMLLFSFSDTSNVIAGCIVLGDLQSDRIFKIPSQCSTVMLELLNTRLYKGVSLFGYSANLHCHLCIQTL